MSSNHYSITCCRRCKFYVLANFQNFCMCRLIKKIETVLDHCRWGWQTMLFCLFMRGTLYIYVRICMLECCCCYMSAQQVVLLHDMHVMSTSSVKPCNWYGQCLLWWSATCWMACIYCIQDILCIFVCWWVMDNIFAHYVAFIPSQKHYACHHTSMDLVMTGILWWFGDGQHIDSYAFHV